MSTFSKAEMTAFDDLLGHLEAATANGVAKVFVGDAIDFPEGCKWVKATLSNGQHVALVIAPVLITA